MLPGNRQAAYTTAKTARVGQLEAKLLQEVIEIPLRLSAHVSDITLAFHPFLIRICAISIQK